MKTILLTQGKVAFVDDEDFERLNAFKWTAAKRRDTFYAVRQASRVNFGPQRMVLMHREIMSAPNNIHVDHENGDGLDNRKENLRLASRRQNMQNRRKRIVGFKGVYLDRRRDRWYSEIRTENGKKFLGSFKSALEAARAYDAAAIKIFGEFARPNFNQQPQN